MTVGRGTALVPFGPQTPQPNRFPPFGSSHCVGPAARVPRRGFNSQLAAQDATKAEIVKLRFFVGLENREIAELLGISERTVERAWRFAKAWLRADFNEG